MSQYFTNPFPFQKIIKRSGSIAKVDLDASIREHISSLVLMRIGEFAYDRGMGFELWDYDKHVFYHDREPYYEGKEIRKGLMENAHARKHFKENLKVLLEKNEVRLKVGEVRFGFEQVSGNMSVYQRKIVIEVHGRLKSTGKILNPHFQMSILYTPFKIESN